MSRKECRDREMYFKWGRLVLMYTFGRNRRIHVMQGNAVIGKCTLNEDDMCYCIRLIWKSLIYVIKGNAGIGKCTLYEDDMCYFIRG